MKLRRQHVCSPPDWPTRPVRHGWRCYCDRDWEVRGHHWLLDAYGPPGSGRWLNRWRRVTLVGLWLDEYRRRRAKRRAAPYMELPTQLLALPAGSWDDREQGNDDDDQ